MENIRRSKGDGSLPRMTTSEETTSSHWDFASKTEFVNWTTSVLALTIAKDALLTLVEEKFKAFLKQFNDEEFNTFLNCLKTNKVKHIIMKETKQKWSCSHTACTYIFMELLKIHSCNPTKRWSIEISSNQETSFNSFGKSREYVWDIAHLYTDVLSNDEEKGYWYYSLEGHIIAHIIRIMRSCKLFQYEGSAYIYDKVLTTINKLVHSPINMTTEKELNETFDLLYDLLKTYEDYRSCRHGIADLEKLKTYTLPMHVHVVDKMNLLKDIKDLLKDDFFVSRRNAMLPDIHEYFKKHKRVSVEAIDRIIQEYVIRQLTELIEKELNAHTEIEKTLQNACTEKGKEELRAHMTKGLPPEITRMDEKSIELYKQALVEGSMPDYDVRVMIVGHSNVGKTTLKKRLFDETVDIKERNSTQGIDVHVGKCLVHMVSGKWIVQEKDVRLEILYQRLFELLSRNHPPSNPNYDTDEEKEHEEKPVSLSNGDSLVRRLANNVKSYVLNRGWFKTSLPPSHPEAQAPSHPEAQSPSHPEAQSPSHVSEQSQSLSVAQSVEPLIIRSGNETNDERSYRRTKEKCISDLKEILQHSSNIDTNQQTSELSIWDFAGQSDFYAMHQVFLSHRAVILLVTKLTEHIDDAVDDQRLIDCTGKKYRKIGDLIEFWLNSIYEYVGNDDSNDPIRQNVILVGTHADQIKEDPKENSTSNLFDTVRMSLADKVTFNLLTEKGFLVNNVLSSTDPSSTIGDIRKYILETASKQSYWGKPIPAKWCSLEKILMELRKKGTKILKVSDVVDLNEALPVPLQSDEIDLFLRVHHERGNILFYGNEHQLNENIILDPQWLIDAFKSIMTSCSFCCTKQTLAKHWAEFEQTAVLQRQLIDFIWEQEGYSEFRQHSTSILCFMEKLGLIAKPYQLEMPEETKTTVDYFVPYFLKRKPPEKILNTAGNKAKYSSKLCITTKSGFLPNTIFNKLLAACIQNFKPSGPPGETHIYCGCGVFDVGTNCHLMFVCFADNVIYVWLSRLSSHENPDSSECKKISDFILNILKKDLTEVVIFYKCWKASVESKVKLFQENLQQNKRVICYCQKDGHSVEYLEITQYWQTKTPENSDKFLASSHPVLPSSQSTSEQQWSCDLSGQPFGKESDDTMSGSMMTAFIEQMKSVGVLIFRGHVMGTVFRIGSKYVMTAYHVVKCIIDPHNTRSRNISQLDHTLIHFNDSAVLSIPSYSVQKLVMFNDMLDVAVLKIADDGHLPAKMVLAKSTFVGSEVSLIGYGNPNKPNLKHTDPRCLVVKPRSAIMEGVLNWFQENSSYFNEVFLKCGQDTSLVHKGYRGYDNESRLMFHCYMLFGASGAPVLSYNDIRGDVQVVGVYTHGLPEFFFKLPDSERHKFPKNCLLEGGSKMEHIYKWIHDDYNNYVKEFFN